MFRVGDEFSLRLPRRAGADCAFDDELRHMPGLAGKLPLAIPAPLAIGDPGSGYPYRFMLSRWIRGHDAFRKPPRDLLDAADRLAGFLTTLHGLTPDVPVVARTDLGARGCALSARHEGTLAFIDDCANRGFIEPEQLQRLWQLAIDAPEHNGPPRFIHGDIHAGNLLVHNGALTAVIDFGELKRGDPAVDLQVAWNLLDQPARRRFRRLMNADDAEWRRGMGWAVSVALVALPYYVGRNPLMEFVARHSLREAQSDLADGEL
ncbi:MAG: aminoglycoside phosphotransferase family protein [Hyphomicrobiaceae bacterium]|nr:aminoglycoside phosphotransferase family protein [Hyphomicrobiaceae bacterium]